MSKGKRMNIRLSEEDDALIRKYYEVLGISMSQLAGIAVHAGLKAVLRAIAPEETISSHKLAEITQEMLRLDAEKGGVK